MTKISQPDTFPPPDGQTEARIVFSTTTNPRAGMGSTVDGLEGIVASLGGEERAENHAERVTNFIEEHVLGAALEDATTVEEACDAETTQRSKRRCVTGSENQKKLKAGDRAKQAAYDFMKGKYVSMNAAAEAWETSRQLVCNYYLPLRESGEAEAFKPDFGFQAGFAHGAIRLQAGFAPDLRSAFKPDLRKRTAKFMSWKAAGKGPYKHLAPCCQHEKDGNPRPACDCAVKRADGRTAQLGNEDLLMVVTQPWMLAFSRKNNISAWRRIGIEPFNRRVYLEARDREEKAARNKHLASAAVMSSVDVGRMMGEGHERDLGGAEPEAAPELVVEQGEVDFRMMSDSELSGGEQVEGEQVDEDEEQSGPRQRRLAEQELEGASDSSEEVVRDEEWMVKVRKMKFNSTVMWDKPATSKQMMAFAQQKEKDIEARAQKSVENRVARQEKKAQQRREAWGVVRELEQIVVAAGGQWVIGTRAGSIHKAHIIAVYVAFEKLHPPGSWRDWLAFVQEIVGWDAALNKFSSL